MIAEKVRQFNQEYVIIVKKVSGIVFEVACNPL
jgi:hypothetical protein